MSSALARRAGIKRAYPIKAETTIGACVAVFLAAGLAVPFARATGADMFVGVSTFCKTNAGLDGESKVEVECQEFALVNAGDIGFADVGSTAYFSAALYVSLDSSGDTRPIAGIITEIDDNLVWIRPAAV